MSLSFLGDAALYLDKELGVIGGLKSKLVKSPGNAADKLVIVLEEISKIYRAIDGEVSDYLCLHFEGNDNFHDDRKVLVRLESGSLQTRMEEARGHCHKIWNIYEKHLKTWFDEVFRENRADADELHGVFNRLAYSDCEMMEQIFSVVTWLAPEAEATLNLVDDGKFHEADERILAARKEVLPARKLMAGIVAQLRALQAEFIEKSSTT